VYLQQLLFCFFVGFFNFFLLLLHNREKHALGPQCVPLQNDMTRFPPIFLNKFTAMNKLNIGTNGAQQWIKKRIKIIKKK
jgi:hypothetical protein